MKLAEVCAAVSGKLPKLLPMVHSTRAERAMEILAQGFIEPRMCKVFHTPLSYFFYGKNAYRVDTHLGTTAPPVTPVVFVFNTPRAFRMSHALDTGAVAANIFSKFLVPMSADQGIQAAEIGSKSELLRKAVVALYGSNRDYLMERTDQMQKLSIPTTSFHLQQLVSLFKADAWGELFDERRRTFEIQVDAQIAVNASTVKWLVYPRSYDSDPEFRKLTSKFTKQQRVQYPGHHATQALRAHYTSSNSIEELVLAIA